MIVEFDIHGRRRVRGQVLRDNDKTVVVRYKGKIIKRHKEKYNVVVVSENMKKPFTSEHK